MAINELEWHKITLDELFRRLSTSPERGLAAEQVQRRVVEYGPNAPSPPPSRLLRDIAGYFFEGFGSILVLGGILVFVCWKPLGHPPASANLALAIVLLIVFFLQGAFNAWQHWSSSKIMASITTMLPDRCLVVRDGNQIEVSAPEVVPGYVLCIKAGNKLPADVRLVEISPDAKFDRSILTGIFTRRDHLMEETANATQANPYLLLARLILLTITIWRHTVLACKVHTACPELVWV